MYEDDRDAFLERRIGAAEHPSGHGVLLTVAVTMLQHNERVGFDQGVLESGGNWNAFAAIAAAEYTSAAADM